MIKREIVCVDDTKPLDPEIAKKFSKWIVNKQIYSIRKLQQNFDGTWGVLLNEIVNPLFSVKLRGETLGVAEPGFALHRFRYLDGTPIEATIKQEEIVKMN